MGIRVIQGPLHSRWSKFAKSLQSAYPSHVRIVSSYIPSGGNTTYICPAELLPASAPPGSLYIYVSALYQVQDEFQFARMEAKAALFLAGTPQLAKVIEEKCSSGIQVVAIALSANDENWSSIVGQQESPSTPTRPPRKTGSSKQRGSSVLTPVRSGVVVGPSPPLTVNQIPCSDASPHGLLSLLPTETSDIIYSVNAEYQLDHLLGLLSVFPGDVLFPKPTSDFKTARGELDQVSSFSGKRIPCRTHEEFISRMRGKFLISTGIFRAVASSNYPHSLFVSHGVSDKKFYHRQAARANFALYASSGPYFTKLYMDHGIPKQRIIQCGYLRTESPVEPYEPFDVLFAPTHRTNALTDYSKDIIAACEAAGLSLVIRPHPLTKSHEFDPVANIIRPFLCDSRISTWTLLNACRSVITDVSTISFEALLLDKPVTMVQGRPSWANPARTYSGNFGDVISADARAYFPRALDRMLTGKSISRIAKSDVFYLGQSPSRVIDKRVQEYLSMLRKKAKSMGVPVGVVHADHGPRRSLTQKIPNTKAITTTKQAKPREPATDPGQSIGIMTHPDVVSSSPPTSFYGSVIRPIIQELTNDAFFAGKLVHIETSNVWTGPPCQHILFAGLYSQKFIDHVFARNPAMRHAYVLWDVNHSRYDSDRVTVFSLHRITEFPYIHLGYIDMIDHPPGVGFKNGVLLDHPNPSGRKRNNPELEWSHRIAEWLEDSDEHVAMLPITRSSFTVGANFDTSGMASQINPSDYPSNVDVLDECLRCTHSEMLSVMNEYRVFIVTHAEKYGQQAIEAAQIGCTVLAPRGFLPDDVVTFFRIHEFSTSDELHNLLYDQTISSGPVGTMVKPWEAGVAIIRVLHSAILGIDPSKDKFPLFSSGSITRQIIPNRVSVIMTAFKAEKWIQDSVASVLSQELPHGWEVEVVVAVDACDSSYKAVCKIKDDRLRIAMCASNKGTYIAKNTVEPFITGCIVGFLDSDDILQPGHLSAVIKKLYLYDMVNTWFTNCDENLRPIQIKEIAVYGSWFFRRSAFLSLGGFRDWTCGADSELSTRARYMPLRACTIEKSYLLRRLHAGSLTSDKKTGMGSELRRSYSSQLAKMRRKYKDGVKPALIIPVRNSITSWCGPDPGVLHEFNPPYGRYQIDGFGSNDNMAQLCRDYLKSGGNLTIDSSIFCLGKPARLSPLCTPFKEVKHLTLAQTSKDCSPTKPQENMATEETIAPAMVDALKRSFVRWFSINDCELDIFCSSGLDSQILVALLSSLRDEGHVPPGGLRFICRPPEHQEFIRIMKLFGWEEDNYRIQDETSDDVYGITEFKRMMNGWCPKPYLLCFPVINEDAVVVQGNYGEIARYLLQKKMKTSGNNLLNMSLKYHSNFYLVRESFQRLTAQNMLLPFLSYEAMECWARLDISASEYSKLGADSFRLRLAHLLGIDDPIALAYKTKPPEWNWNISDKKKADGFEAFRRSWLCRTYFDGRIPKGFDPFGPQKMWQSDGALFSFAQTCEHIYES